MIIQSYYFYFDRRTACQFRIERFHRLIIPALFRMWVTNILITFVTSPKKFSEKFHTDYCLLWKLDPDVGWFLFYMFVYSLLFTSSFLKWHPRNECGKRIYFLGIPQTSETYKMLMRKMLIGPIKLIFNPTLVLAMIEILTGPKVFAKCEDKTRPHSKDLQYNFWYDWCSHFTYSFLYFLGYAIISIESSQLDKIFKKYGVLYLFCGTCCMFIKISLTLVGGTWVGGYYTNEMEYITIIFLKSIGEWMFIIGLYATLTCKCTKTFEMMKILRELSMPYYMTHTLVNRCLIRADIPRLGVMITLVLQTLLCGLCSLFIVKSPGFVRYFFGLPSNEKALLSKWMKGFGPFVLLVVIRIIEYLIANNAF